MKRNWLVSLAFIGILAVALAADNEVALDADDEEQAELKKLHNHLWQLVEARNLLRVGARHIANSVNRQTVVLKHVISSFAEGKPDLKAKLEDGAKELHDSAVGIVRRMSQTVLSCAKGSESCSAYASMLSSKAIEYKKSLNSDDFFLPSAADARIHPQLVKLANEMVAWPKRLSAFASHNYKWMKNAQSEVQVLLLQEKQFRDDLKKREDEIVKKWKKNARYAKNQAMQDVRDVYLDLSDDPYADMWSEFEHEVDEAREKQKDDL